MIEQVTGGGGNLSPIRREQIREQQRAGFSPEALSAFADSAATPELSGYFTDLRQQIIGIAGNIDSSLSKITRQQIREQSSGRAHGIVDSIRMLQTEYLPGEPDDEIGAAQNNAFATEQAALRRTLQEASFQGEPLIETGEAMDTILNAPNLRALGDAPATAADAMRATQADAGRQARQAETELATHQVALQNLQSTDAPESADALAAILDRVSGGFRAGELPDIDRSHVLSLLGE